MSGLWNKINRDLLSKSLIPYPLAILSFFSILLFLTATEWLVLRNTIIPVANLFIGMSFFAYVIYISRKNISLYGGIFFIILMILASVLSIFIFDFSYDGQTYHQFDILYMGKIGWNPIYNADQTDYIWARYYVKGAEILAANLYVVFKNIEFTKIVNFMSAFAMLFLALEYYKNRLPLLLALFISVIISFPTVVITQILTFYVDGFLYGMMGAYLFTTLLHYEKEQALFKMDFLLIKVLILLIAVGIKSSALAYFFFFVGADMLLFAVRRKAFFKESSFLFSAVLFSLLYLNCHPHINNWIEKKNPFYPLVGKDKIDILYKDRPKNLWGNTPPDFRSISGIRAFFLSYTSRPEHVNLNFKLPIYPIPQEIKTVSDLRINGFAWYMPYYLYAGIALLLWMLFTIKRRDYRIPLFLVAIWVSVFTNPAPWWARYVPQLWFVLIFTISSFLQELKNQKNARIGWGLFVSLLTIDMGGQSIAVLAGKFNETYKFKKVLTQNKDKKILLALNVPHTKWAIPSFEEKIERYHNPQNFEVVEDIEVILGEKTRYVYSLWYFYIIP